MLKLNSIRWSELQHAYGSAEDIPHLLSQLSSLPESNGDDEPWFSLWNSLAHQGDVYPASFAAVPFVIDALALNPVKAGAVYFHFPAWVEICRQKKSIPIQENLANDYCASLARLPQLVAEASSRPWSSEFLQCALSAIAVAKGYCSAAEVVQELSPEVSVEFLEWFYER